MTTKKLSSVAISNIHRGVQFDFKRAEKIFLQLHPQTLSVSNLTLDEE